LYAPDIGQTIIAKIHNEARHFVGYAVGYAKGLLIIYCSLVCLASTGSIVCVAHAGEGSSRVCWNLGLCIGT
jgi:hypothetical protein